MKRILMPVAALAVVLAAAGLVAAGGTHATPSGTQGAGPTASRAAAAPAATSQAPTATIQRTFVSTSGNDANPCTRPDPCRNFAAAITNTTAGGEVVALDSGGYGAFTVAKAIAIAGAPGAHVAVTAFAGTAVLVNAGAGDAVVLRNLYVTGLGGDTGIWFQGGRSLFVEHVVAAGFTQNGLYANAAGASLVIQDSVFRNTLAGDQTASGVYVNAALRVEIADSRADGNDYGFALDTGASGSIVRSSATRNGFTGFWFDTGAVAALTDDVADGNGETGVSLFADNTHVTVRAATLTNNGEAGLVTAAPGTPLARISDSTVTANNAGLQQGSGTLESFGDNLVRGNTTETAGTITTVGKT